jgi:hypothetical protein
MSVQREQIRPQPAPRPNDDPRAELIQRVLAQIREDAQKDPKVYLRDTLVPGCEE